MVSTFCLDMPMPLSLTDNSIPLPAVTAADMTISPSSGVNSRALESIPSIICRIFLGSTFRFGM